MKKNKLLSVFLSIAFLIILIPGTVSATDKITVEYLNPKLIVTFPYALEEPAALAAAAYDGNGNLTDIKISTLNPGTSGTEIDTLAVAHNYKAFLLNPTTGSPLYKSGETSNSAITLYAENGYVPNLDDDLTASISAAVDARAEAESAMKDVWPLLTESQLQNISASGFLAYAEPAFDAWERAYNAAAIAEMTADKKAAQGYIVMQSEILPMSNDAAAQWEQEITEQWNLTKDGKKLEKFSEELGCDARRAYKLLKMAQNILEDNYESDEDNLYEICEETAANVKTGMKVGVFVCETSATEGAATADGFSAAQATGVLACGVDCLIEVSDDASKIVLGSDNKVSKRAETGTDSTYLFGLFTGGDTSAEKLLFLGDLAEKDGYDYIKAKQNGNTVSVDVTRIEASDGNTIKNTAEGLFGKDNAGFAAGGSGKTEAEQIDDFTKDRGSNDIALFSIFDRIKLASEKYNDKIKEYKDKYDTILKSDGLDIDTGGNAGGVDTPEPETDDEKQAHVVSSINSLLNSLNKITTFTKKENQIIIIITDVMNSVLNDAKNGIPVYVKKNVRKTYSDRINSARDLYNNLSQDEKDFFITKLGTIPSNDASYLLKTIFNKDMEDMEKYH